MATSPLTVEVPFIQRDANSKLPLINVATELDEAKYEFPARSTAGSTFKQGPSALFTPTNNGRALIWRTTADEPNVLSVHYLALGGDHRNSDVEMHFAHPILPWVGSVDIGSKAQLAVLSADAALHIYTVEYDAHPTSLEQALTAPRAHISISLESFFDRLGAPTCMLYVGDHLCIGSADGNIVCLPRADYDPDTAFELKATGGGFGLTSVLGGFFAKQPAQEVQQMVELNFMGNSLLCTIHDGCMLKVWDVASRRLCHSNALLPEPAVAANYTASIARIAMEPVDTSTSILMVYFTPKNGGDGGGQLITYEIFVEDRDSAFKVQLEAGPRLDSSLTGLLDITVQHLGPHSVGAWLLFDEHVATTGKKLVCLPLSFTDGEIQPACEGHVLDDQFASVCVTDPTTELIRQEAWQLLQQQASATDTMLPANVAAEMYTDILTSPGLLSRPALRATLAAMGCSEQSAKDSADVELEKLQERLVGWLEEAGQDPSSLKTWDAFLTEYVSQWKVAHKTVALCAQMTNKGDHVVMVVRQGGIISIMRTAATSELALTGTLQFSTDRAIVSGMPLRDHEARARKNVLTASKAVSVAAGGRATMRLLWACAKHGAELHTVILPAVVKTLTAGAASSSSQGTGNYQQQDQRAKLRSEWRTACRKLPLHLASSCNIPRKGFASTVGSLLTALAHHQWMTNRPIRSPLSHPTTPINNATLATAAQVSWAQIEALMQLTLLCTWVSTLHTMGSVQLDDADAEDLVTRLIPKATRMLEAALAAYWTAVTPLSSSLLSSDASGGAGGVEGSSMSMSLQLNQPSGKRARLSPVSAPQACRLLLPMGYAESSHAVRDLTDLESVANSFSHWLLCVREIEAFEGDAILAVYKQQDEPIQPLQRTLPLAFELFRQKHAAQLIGLLRLLEVSGEDVDARVLFFQACSKARSIKHAATPEERTQLEQQAVALFFRTATIFAHPEHFDEQVSAIRMYLGQLHRDTTQLELPDEGPAAIQLQFYETLMLLFERLGCATAASQLAHAAAQLVRAMPDDNAAEKAKREGRLWVNVFAHNLEAREYEEAYAALLSSAVPELQVECLHLLVNQLCAQNQVELLCRLPFAHTLLLSKGGNSTFVPLLEEAIAALERRAANLDLADEPQPYKVLYAFHTSRHNMQGAAAAMLAYARRLQTERPGQKSAIVEAERAMGVAAAALSLVELEQAWLLDPAPMASTSGLQGVGAAASPNCAVLTIEDLKKERAVLKAEAAIVDVMPSAFTDAETIDTDEVFDKLLELGLHDEAFTLLDAVYSGTQLADAREQAIAALAEHCLILQSGGGGAAIGGDIEMEDASGDQGVLAVKKNTGTQSAQACWRRLARHLRRYEENHPQGYRLRLIAADAILAREPKFCLPPWLIAPFMPPLLAVPASVLGGGGSELSEQKSSSSSSNAADFGGLVRLYMRYNRLQDAATVAARQLAILTQSVPSVTMSKTGVVCYPHGLLDELLVRMEENDSCAALREELSGLLEQERAAAEKQTEAIAQIYS